MVALLKTYRNIRGWSRTDILCGGAKEDRTPDLYNAIVALSQLS